MERDIPPYIPGGLLSGFDPEAASRQDGNAYPAADPAERIKSEREKAIEGLKELDRREGKR